MEAYTIHDYVEFTDKVVSRTKELKPTDPTQQMMGLLFMREGQQIVDKEIVPSLPYFDERSGDAIDFYIPGWDRRQQFGMGNSSEKFATFDVKGFTK
jgi:hypothetical protein